MCECLTSKWYSCLSLIRISRGQDFCSNYRAIRIVESILQGFLKDGDFTFVPIRERFGLQRFGLERLNCTCNFEKVDENKKSFLKVRDTRNGKAATERYIKVQATYNVKIAGEGFCKVYSLMHQLKRQGKDSARQKPNSM